jgi:hypothetical protein
VLQVRIKPAGGADAGELVRIARWRRICATRAPLVVNDRVDVASRSTPTGALASPICAAEARRIADLWIGSRPTTSRRSARREASAALGFGPVFATTTKASGSGAGARGPRGSGRGHWPACGGDRCITAATAGEVYRGACALRDRRRERARDRGGARARAAGARTVDAPCDRNRIAPDLGEARGRRCNWANRLAVRSASCR